MKTPSSNIRRTLLMLAMIVVGAFATAGIICAARAEAIPPQPGVCISGGWAYAMYEDCDLWPDGSFWHREYGGFIGFQGRSGRVCDGMPPPFTDNNPSTPCPGW